jgi:site-specific DNA-methyltransferase (adenine-specific)
MSHIPLNAVSAIQTWPKSIQSLESVSVEQDFIAPISRAYMPPSQTDDWATPKAFYDKLNEVHEFDLDVAASSTNHLCDDWYGLDHPDESRKNGLEAEWYGHVWCNPPYGRGIKDWVLKASQHHDLVVMLLPARTDTRWFHDLVLPNANVTFVRGRIKFGTSNAGAPFPSMVVEFPCCE